MPMRKLLVGLLFLLFTFTAFAQFGVSAASQTVVTVTSTSTQFLSLRANRRFLIIQNNDATGNVFVNFGAAATTAHIKVIPGANLFLDSNTPITELHMIGSIASNPNVVVIEGF